MGVEKFLKVVKLGKSAAYKSIAVGSTLVTVGTQLLDKEPLYGTIIIGIGIFSILFDIYLLYKLKKLKT